MAGLIATALIIGSALLGWIRSRNSALRAAADALAALGFLGFFTVAARSSVRALLDDTVFMTQIHEVLLSPVFLACSAYLGPYALSLLAACAWSAFADMRGKREAR